MPKTIAKVAIPLMIVIPFLALFTGQLSISWELLTAVCLREGSLVVQELYPLLMSQLLRCQLLKKPFHRPWRMHSGEAEIEFM